MISSEPSVSTSVAATSGLIFINAPGPALPLVTVKTGASATAANVKVKSCDADVVEPFGSVESTVNCNTTSTSEC